jgi:hypothetical protein
MLNCVPLLPHEIYLRQPIYESFTYENFNVFMCFFSFCQSLAQIYGYEAADFHTTFNTLIFPGVKRPGREADHLPPSSVEVKNDGVVPPLPTRLHGVVLN